MIDATSMPASLTLSANSDGSASPFFEGYGGAAGRSQSRGIRRAHVRADGLVRRWWTLTTGIEFLASRGSRRDLWVVLLPLPGLFAIFTDAPDGTLIALDAAVAIAFLGASWLPVHMLWSDAVIAVLNAIFLTLHASMTVEAEQSFTAVPLLSFLSLACAGVHTGTLACSLLCSAFITYIMACGWMLEVLVACVYVLFLGGVTEFRVAQLAALGKQQIGYASGYKALDTYSKGGLFSRVSQGESHATATHSAYHSDSDGEGFHSAPEGPGDATPSCMSRQSVADNVLSRISASDLSSRSSLVDYVRSNLPFLPGVRRHRAGTADAAPARFEAQQVVMPGAASHEAPEFAEAQTEMKPDWRLPIPQQRDQAIPIVTFGSPTGFEASPTPGRQPCASTVGQVPRRGAEVHGQSEDRGEDVVLRGVKLVGFSHPELNVLFVERRAPAFLMNSRETFWSAAGDFFVYSSTANTWGVAKAKRFVQVKEGTSHGVAHSPEGCDIWDPALPKGWREWSANDNKWLVLPEAGVESRGKVRPMTGVPSKIDVGTQTDETRMGATPDQIRNSNV